MSRHQAGLTRLTNTDLAAGLECQSQVKKRKRVHKRRSQSHRKCFLDQLAEEWAARDKTSRAAALRQLSAQESQRSALRRIRFAHRQSESQGITSVMGPDPLDPTKETEFTSQLEVEQAILAENQRRFAQAGTTPLLQSLCPSRNHTSSSGTAIFSSWHHGPH